jgi:hypothetical protein
MFEGLEFENLGLRPENSSRKGSSIAARDRCHTATAAVPFRLFVAKARRIPRFLGGDPNLTSEASLGAPERFHHEWLSR